MNKKVLCGIVGITSFGAGMVVSKVLLNIALKEVAKESRERRKSAIDKNDFSDYLNREYFNK